MKQLGVPAGGQSQSEVFERREDEAEVSPLDSVAAEPTMGEVDECHVPGG